MDFGTEHSTLKTDLPFYSLLAWCNEQSISLESDKGGFEFNLHYFVSYNRGDVV